MTTRPVAMPIRTLIGHFLCDMARVPPREPLFYGREIQTLKLRLSSLSARIAVLAQRES
jgi:hypothetical protein